VIGLIAVTAAGRAAAQRLAAAWPETRRYDQPAAKALPSAFEECDAIICFLAVGATVRLIAPLLRGKADDPAIVCVDEALRYAVPVLGGHAAGANNLARRAAGNLGARPVITTASDAVGSVALDDLSAALGFTIDPASDLAAVGAAILSGIRVTLTTDQQWPLPPLPPNVVPTATPEPNTPAVIVTDQAQDHFFPERVVVTPSATAPSTVVERASARAPASGEPEPLASPTSLQSPPSPVPPPPEIRDPGIGDPLRTPIPRSTTPETEPGRRWVVLRPPSLIVGVGASRGVNAAEVGGLIDQALADAGLSPQSVRLLATADLKADEPGILAAARERGWPVVTFPAAQLAAVPVPNPSEVVRSATGTPSVAEAAALLGAHSARTTAPAAGSAGQVSSAGLAPVAAGGVGPVLAGDAGLGSAGAAGSAPSGGVGHDTYDALLVVTKRASAHATVAIARVAPRGRLALVGIGPGARDLMTPRAVAELRRASVVVGLDQYVEQIADLLRPGTRVLASGLGSEQERAATAVAEASAGRAVALIGSGDAGIYAMASPALELADDRIDVIGVPGVTAALAAAALLGAPLGHDHAVISLSDLHTPWKAIEQRIEAAAEADLVTCFYNPASEKRTWQLRRALEILAATRPPDTPVGWVRDASRPAQSAALATLSTFDPAAVDMRTLVIVGSSRTRAVAGRMITPREYTWAST
jgi:cobalt-precorrin 5A hydrolase/precorrin-3B C17-methyltransferase